MKYLISQIVCYFSCFSRKLSPKYFSISHYASVSTQTSVLIIGGESNNLYTSSIVQSSIVQYIEDKWTAIGNLKRARLDHQAILIGSLVMIIGGHPSYWSNDQL